MEYGLYNISQEIKVNLSDKVPNPSSTTAMSD